jgi:hypothetical protein
MPGLNPLLYSLLVQQFKHVMIANEGIQMSGAPAMATATAMTMPGDSFSRASSGLPAGPFNNRRRQSRPLTWGEYYRVNCPFCHDSRQRLWINYLYGQEDDRGAPQHWLAHCFNEPCMDTFGNRRALEDLIFRSIGRHMRREAVILPGEDISSALIQVRPPGSILRLSELYPGHKALQYIGRRQYTPEYLQQAFDIGYVLEAERDFWAARDRLYIPIKMQGQLVGWQTRYLEDVDWKTSGIPKYYGRPGMPKSRMLYNFDTAKDWPFVVVVEGAPSVWRIGGPAVALLGKTLTGPQQMLLRTWTGKPIIIMLDNDAIQQSEGILRELQRLGTSPVAMVRLPDKFDPGDYTHELDVQMIRNAAFQANITLPAW